MGGLLQPSQRCNILRIEPESVIGNRGRDGRLRLLLLLLLLRWRAVSMRWRHGVAAAAGAMLHLCSTGHAHDALPQPRLYRMALQERTWTGKGAGRGHLCDR